MAISRRSFKNSVFLEPERHRDSEGAQAFRGKRQIRLEQPLEFRESLVVENDAVERREIDSRLREAVANCLAGNSGSCFFRVNRSAATISPSRKRAAALSW